VSSLQIQAGPLGPSVFRSYFALSDLRDADVRQNQWWCQYFKANLPANANGWRISSVEVYARQVNAGQALRARVYKTTPITANLVDAATLTSSGFATSFAWHPIAFAGNGWLNRGDAVFVAFESDSSITPIRLKYRDQDVSEADSALLQGDPSWISFQTNKALLYRINGFYTTSGGMAPVAATWIWDGP
jgi:hypothetical protein